MAWCPWMAATGAVSASLHVASSTGDAQITCSVLSMSRLGCLFARVARTAHMEPVDCRSEARPGFADEAEGPCPTRPTAPAGEDGTLIARIG